MPRLVHEWHIVTVVSELSILQRIIIIFFLLGIIGVTWYLRLQRPLLELVQRQKIETIKLREKLSDLQAILKKETTNQTQYQTYTTILNNKKIFTNSFDAMQFLFQLFAKHHISCKKISSQSQKQQNSFLLSIKGPFEQLAAVIASMEKVNIHINELECSKEKNDKVYAQLSCFLFQ